MDLVDSSVKRISTIASAISVRMMVPALMESTATTANALMDMRGGSGNMILMTATMRDVNMARLVLMV